VYVGRRRGRLILRLSIAPKGNEELRERSLALVYWSPRKGLSARLAVCHIGHCPLCSKKVLTLSFEPDRAVAVGLPIREWDFLVYVMLVWLCVTSFVQIGGVMLVFLLS